MTELETVILQRNNTSKSVTFGTMFRDGRQIAVTAELPWCQNAPNISCIPAGTYLFTRTLSPTKGEVFLGHDIPNRQYIEIHAFNTPLRESEGCIGIGDTCGKIHGMDAVLNSKATLAKLLQELPAEFYLQVINPAGHL